MNSRIHLSGLILCVVSILMTGCQSNTGTQESFDSEEYLVYDRVIEDMFLYEGVFKSIVLRDRTKIDLPSGERLDKAVAFIRNELGTAIEAETLKSFQDRNQRGYPLEDHFNIKVPMLFLNDTQWTAIFSNGNSWKQFYSTYPGSQGVLAISRVGMNSSKDQALLYIGNTGGDRVGSGYYIYLLKKEGNWEIVNSLLAWIS